MCDCRPQVAGQYQFSLTPAVAAERVTLNITSHGLRDLSEPASIHIFAATALGSPTVSISSCLTVDGPVPMSGAYALDHLLGSPVAVRLTGSSTDRPFGELPVNQSNLAVPFALSWTPFPHPGVVVERFSDNKPCSGEHPVILRTTAGPAHAPNWQPVVQERREQSLLTRFPSVQSAGVTPLPTKGRA